MSGFPERRDVRNKPPYRSGLSDRFEGSERLGGKQSQIMSTVDGQFDSVEEEDDGGHTIPIRSVDLSQKGGASFRPSLMTHPPPRISSSATIVSEKSNSSNSTSGDSQRHSTASSSDGTDNRLLRLADRAVGSHLSRSHAPVPIGRGVREDAASHRVNATQHLQSLSEDAAVDNLFNSLHEVGLGAPLTATFQSPITIEPYGAHGTQTAASSVSDLSGHSLFPEHPPSKRVDNTTKTSSRLPQYKLTAPPKSELYTLYGKDPYRRVLGAGDYITWNDNGPPHTMRFTSVFVCPVTGEAFKSGGYGKTYEWKDSFCWFTSKKLAEHGAAARAYDCLSYRRAPPGLPHYYLGDEEPYTREARRPLSPTGIPTKSWSLIVDAQSRAPRFDSDEEVDIDLFGPSTRLS
jgi:hypothetical protein